MPINPSFSINAIPQVNPAAIALVDTSTGTDAAIADRQIFLFEVDNSLLIPATDWPYAQGSITLTPLTQDVALSISINWLDAGANILYTSSQIFAFTGYSEAFLYQLTQNQTSQPNIVVDTNYYNNKMKLREELDAAKSAISVGFDIYSAQSCLQRAIYMISNSNFFF
jgi:hypothetical protein